MKSFLEEYGLIIVAAIVVLAVIVFASQFSDKIVDAIGDLIDTLTNQTNGILTPPAGGGGSGA